jgi:hypothetical protein
VSVDIIAITYAEATAMIDEWLPVSGGKTFEARDLYAEFGIVTRKSKQVVSRALQEYVKHHKLDGRDGKYRFVDNTVEELDWVQADPNDILDIKWPYGLEDGTAFGFDDNLTLYPGSIVVVSGVSNMGKSTFMLNMLVMNMDAWKVQYLTNEMGAEEFADRIKNLEQYFDLVDENGKPKFRAAARFDNYQDVIMPDGLNIIDYLDPGENAFLVGKQIDAIRQRLNRGCAFIALQKKITTIATKDGPKQVHSDYGTGGQYSEHRARVVIHIEPEYLLVKKAKKCRKYPLSGQKFTYQIRGNGAYFHHIVPMYEGEEERL